MAKVKVTKWYHLHCSKCGGNYYGSSDEFVYDYYCTYVKVLPVMRCGTNLSMLQGNAILPTTWCPLCGTLSPVNAEGHYEEIDYSFRRLVKVLGMPREKCHRMIDRGIFGDATKKDGHWHIPVKTFILD